MQSFVQQRLSTTVAQVQSPDTRQCGRQNGPSSRSFHSGEETKVRRQVRCPAVSVPTEQAQARLKGCQAAV